MSMRIESGGTFDGLKMVVRAGEDIAGYSTVTWDLLGVSEPSVEDAADSADKSPCVGITGVSGIRSGTRGEILLYGVVENLNWNWSIQVPLYLSGTDGVMTEVPTGLIQQEVASTITPTKIFFNPKVAEELEI